MKLENIILVCQWYNVLTILVQYATLGGLLLAKTTQPPQTNGVL